MSPRDTFVFAGEVLRFEGIVENDVVASRTAAGTDPKIPSYAGGKFPLSTFLAERVRAMLADPGEWQPHAGRRGRMAGDAAQQVHAAAARRAAGRDVPARAGGITCVAYPFEGRLAHQTLGMLLTRRLERARLKPLGFVATDYGIAVWGLSRYRRGNCARAA